MLHFILTSYIKKWLKLIVVKIKGRVVNVEGEGKRASGPLMFE